MEAQLRQRLNQTKQDFARLMLGLFATAPQGYPLTFSYFGQAEAPQGKADVVDVKGPANFAARLFIHAETHLPILLSWTPPAGPMMRPGGPGGPGSAPGGPPTAAPGGPPTTAPAAPPAAAPGGPPPAAAGAKPGGPPPPAPEQRMFFADYRDVDGLKFPFRIRRGAGADTTEETTFDRFRINAKVDPRRFDTSTK
jgi:hypothetical protein